MRLWLILALCCCSSCWLLLPASRPMTSTRDYYEHGPARCLVIFLPGVRDVAEDFEDHGFIEAMRKRGLSVDVVSADATLAYYTAGEFIERLGTDVVRPARARGYEQTWLMGLSLGGRGSLIYAHAHPEEITGVLALSPYMGNRTLTKEISAAGGLASWRAPEKLTTRAASDGAYQRELWRWLQAMTNGTEQGPELYLGWGTSDYWLGESLGIIANALPHNRVFPVKGGHKWTTWEKVMDRFLDESDFARSCGDLRSTQTTE
jgi:pimeloyl-ACP methyl ester carboxylesterase